MKEEKKEPGKADTIVKIAAVAIVGLLIGLGALKLLSATSVDVNPPAEKIRFLSAKPDGEIQKVTIQADVYTGKYSPYPAVLKKGVPVELTLDPNIRGCYRNIYAPTLGLQATAQLGKNVQYFIPLKVGKYPFSCSMGMGKGLFQVV